MLELLVYGIPVAFLGTLVVMLDGVFGEEKTKRRVLLAVFRDEPLVEVVRHGKLVREGNTYKGTSELRTGSWGRRRLAVLLVCLTEGLVEEKEGRYVLTEMGRLTFSNPEKRKKNNA